MLRSLHQIIPRVTRYSGITRIIPTRFSSSLISQLKQEIQFEKSSEDFSSSLPADLKEYLNSSKFKLVDNFEPELLKDKVKIKWNIIPDVYEDDSVINVSVDVNGLKYYCQVDYEGQVGVDSVVIEDESNPSATDSSSYEGPVFNELDEKLQESLVEYLQQHLDEDTSKFIVDYSEWKEQVEYVNWLEKVVERVQ